MIKPEDRVDHVRSKSDLARWLRQKGIVSTDDDIQPHLDRVASGDISPAAAAVFVSISLQGLSGNIEELEEALITQGCDAVREVADGVTCRRHRPTYGAPK